MKTHKAVTRCRTCGDVGLLTVKRGVYCASCGHSNGCSGCGSCQYCPICGDDRHKGACPKRAVPDGCPGGDHHKATCPDRKIKTAITERELATVLAALRFWQGQKQRVLPADLADHFLDHNPLNKKEIDALCERLNAEGE